MNEKSHNLQQAVAEIVQRYGPETLRLPASAPHARRHEAFSTSYPTLDAALGVGGVPRASLTAWVGTASTGMLTVALRTAAVATGREEMVVYVDINRSFDAEYAAHSGVLLANVLLLRPASVSDVPEMLHTLLQLGGADLIVVDGAFAAVKATPSEVRSLHHLLRRSTTALLVLNTPRHQGVLTEAADLRVQFERVRWLRRRGAVRGYRTRVSVLKNRFAPPAKPIALTIPLSDRDEVRA
jgi:recombination protein RecA